jgi:hypothetical protein
MSGGVMTMRRRSQLLFTLVLLGLAAAAAPAADVSSQKHPDVISAKVQPRGATRFDFDVTVSSPYDTPQRYADAFRVMAKDGTVYGERVLLHDHATEQPFTRDLYGVTVPAGVRSVVVQARDLKHGWGGKTLELMLPGR